MKTEKTPTENGKNIKKYLPYALCLALFALISLAYFNPVLSGKVLEQGDIKQFAGSAQEILQYRAENHGADPYWTNRMFAGMPGYQITSDFDFNLIKYLDSAIRFLPRPADYAFIFFAGFFALMLAMRAGWKKSLLGALMFGLTTYLYIILEAGHNSKAHAIAYLPLVVAAVVMTYRGKYLWGGIAMAFAMGLEIYANHPQMTYYMGLATAIFVIIYFFECYFKGRLRHFFIATGILALGALVGVGMNAGRLWSTWSYQQHTICGGSELTAEGRQEQKGLDKDYLLMWSYGKGETFNLMIPNLYGGGSQTDLGRGSNIRKAVLDYTGNAMQADQISAAAPTYWPGVRRGYSRVPVHPWSFHRQRKRKMVASGRNRTKFPYGLGQQRHVVRRLYDRPFSHVQQVPYAIFGPYRIVDNDARSGSSGRKGVVPARKNRPYRQTPQVVFQHIAVALGRSVRLSGTAVQQRDVVLRPCR